MTNLEDINGRCTEVIGTSIPNRLIWRFDDGRTVETHELDITVREHRAAIAKHAQRLGLGDAEEVFDHLDWVAPKNEEEQEDFDGRRILPIDTEA